MIRRPPRSTLFPTRRSSDLFSGRAHPELAEQVAKHLDVTITPQSAYSFANRSEEHTSELQSQSNLVCRLLLEKKKQKKNSNHTDRLHCYNYRSYTIVRT